MRSSINPPAFDRSGQASSDISAQAIRLVGLSETVGDDDPRSGQSVLLEIRLIRPISDGTPEGVWVDDRPLLLRVEEAADALAISRSALYPLLGREIPVVRIGRSLRVPRQALEEYVSNRLDDAARWR